MFGVERLPEPPMAPRRSKKVDVSRHNSVAALRGYVCDADALRDHAGADSLWRNT
jgi:hypothetical protein